MMINGIRNSSSKALHVYFLKKVNIYFYVIYCYLLEIWYNLVYQQCLSLAVHGHKWSEYLYSSLGHKLVASYTKVQTKQVCILYKRLSIHSNCTYMLTQVMLFHCWCRLFRGWALRYLYKRRVTSNACAHTQETVSMGVLDSLRGLV